jgi:hypothetical protein
MIYCVPGTGVTVEQGELLRAKGIEVLGLGTTPKAEKAAKRTNVLTLPSVLILGFFGSDPPSSLSSLLTFFCY